LDKKIKELGFYQIRNPSVPYVKENPTDYLVGKRCAIPPSITLIKRNLIPQRLMTYVLAN
jgi:hypothetical protein